MAMRAAHTIVEAGRTIGKTVISIQTTFFTGAHAVTGLYRESWLARPSNRPYWPLGYCDSCADDR